jgi:hypothetical protein
LSLSFHLFCCFCCLCLSPSCFLVCCLRRVFVVCVCVRLSVSQSICLSVCLPACLSCWLAG